MDSIRKPEILLGLANSLAILMMAVYNNRANTAVRDEYNKLVENIRKVTDSLKLHDQSIADLNTAVKQLDLVVNSVKLSATYFEEDTNDGLDATASDIDRLFREISLIRTALAEGNIQVGQVEIFQGSSRNNNNRRRDRSNSRHDTRPKPTRRVSHEAEDEEAERTADNIKRGRNNRGSRN